MPRTPLHRLARLQAATELARQMLTQCTAQVLAAGIPVQANRIRGISLIPLRNTRAICRCSRDENGRMFYTIHLSDRFASRMEDPMVVSHVRNSIIHELLHTCPRCLNHGRTWMHWSAECDRALGTQTRRHMEAPIYYNTLKTPPVIYRCASCGNTYHAVKALEGEVTCELCGDPMTT